MRRGAPLPIIGQLLRDRWHGVSSPLNNGYHKQAVSHRYLITKVQLPPLHTGCESGGKIEAFLGIQDHGKFLGLVTFLTQTPIRRVSPCVSMHYKGFAHFAGV
jgi:hypothetical protein